jgi:AcrR family transcriptional regulator
MTEAVKRDYRSDLRTAQAADTRRSIVATAARMFVETGYGATTIDATAAAAGVSRKTVFTSVGGKVELLKTALDWAVAGDDRPVAMVDRPEMRRLLATDDAVDLLTGWAHVMVGIDVRAAALFSALEVAADSDAEARRLLDEYAHQRLEGARVIVKRLVELDVLTGVLPRADAVDVAWFGTDPVLFDRFVRLRGWSVSRFEAWLARLLVSQLMD